ncbi:MAG: hypothetical protein LBG52_02075 [Candidatus Peribacteria bacterium]|jgi:hypothetical protein|nr:hypothetical protein [Candidatus Peribacteria bacterium]
MSNVASSTSTDLSIKKRVENLKTEYTELIEKQTALAAAQAELSKAIADKEAYFQSEEYLKIEAQYNSIENLIQQALEKKK